MSVESPPGVGGTRRTTWLIVAIVVVAVGVVAGLIAANLSSSPAPAVASGSSPTTTTFPSARGSAPTGFVPPQVSGVVASVASSSFTVTTRARTTSAATTETVSVTGSTTYSGAGITGLSSLKKGTTVAVYGTVTSSSAITATRVAGFAFGGRGGVGRGFGGGPVGAINTIGTNSFTITTRTGATNTVDVSSSTTYSSSSGTLSGLSALKKGEDVVVTGTASGSVVKATAVRVLPAGGGGFSGGFGGGFGGGPAT